MEQNIYNNLEYFIIPLLDDNIVYADISEASGFVGLYTEDINIPQLDNHIFLMYKSLNTNESLNRFIKFEHLDTILSRRYIIINNEHYIVYCFIKNPSSKTNIDNLLQGINQLSVNEKTSIYGFWNSHAMTTELVKRLYVDETFIVPKLILPEEDYYPDILEMNAKENQLVV